MHLQANHNFQRPQSVLQRANFMLHDIRMKEEIKKPVQP